MSLIKILSLNVKGLRNPVKRRALFLYLKNQRADLYCLQETHSKKEDEIPWPSEWGGKILFSHDTEHSKGTCIMQRPNSLFFLKSLRPIYTVRFLLTIVPCNFYSARCSRHGKIVYNFHDIQIAHRYDCRRVLKHVSKAHDILRVVPDNRKQVVGLIYTKRFMS